MPITILDRAEPLTLASLDGESPILIRSDAMRLLEHELRRYCEQKVAGRSFLISGHRGAGKTTLIQGAFQQLSAESRQLEDRVLLSRDWMTGPAPLRPLFVPLLGPNLLPPSLSS